MHNVVIVPKAASERNQYQSVSASLIAHKTKMANHIVMHAPCKTHLIPSAPPFSVISRVPNGNGIMSKHPSRNNLSIWYNNADT